MKNKIFFIILIFIILFLAGTTTYFFYQYQILKYKNSPQTNQQQIQKIVSEVSKLMLLPQGENPTLATVTDSKKLAGQSFFAHATNGDVVLMYPGEKIAILYDPTKHIILNVALISLGELASQPQQTRIAIRNTTNSPTAAGRVATQVLQAFQGADIVKIQQDKTLFPTTIVIPLSDKAQSAAQDLAKSLDITIGVLPAGEPKPTNVDILIIVGEDKASKIP